MTQNKKMTAGVYTIAATRPFLKDLAGGLVARAGTSSEVLSQMVIYLPTRRSARVFSEELLAATKKDVLLSPKILTLGDLDEEWMVDDVDLAAVAPAISNNKRHVLLSELIQARDRKENPASPMGRYQALRLAEALAQLLDEMHINETGFDRLEDLVPDELSRHWQKTLDFLKIISEEWPKVLQEQGLLDPAKHRSEIIEATIKRWEKSPPATPIIAAGSTGSQLITAKLLNAIRKLPQGVVVLPGLDHQIPAKEWDSLTETHPQYHLRRLISLFNISRGAIESWHQEGVPDASRQRLIYEIMRPAASTDQWSTAKEFAADDLKNISAVACDDEQHEAETIALLLRQGWEENKTTALITPDRSLSVRVRANLRRWNIHVDDSAGAPIPQTPLGVFILTLARLSEKQDDVVTLMSLLKHPFYKKAYGEEAIIKADLALRGPRPGNSLNCLKRILETKKEADAVKMIEGLDQSVQAIASAKTFALKWQAHLKAIRDLSVELSPEDEETLGVVADSLADMPSFDLTESDSYEDILYGFLSREVTRSVFKSDAKIHIWGVLESRLMGADTVIMAGLNEGTWPIDPGADPWLSRPMRTEIELMPHDRRIGQMAHDFSGLFAAPKIIMTRAVKKAGTPTIPARWLMRLDALMTIKGDKKYLESHNDIAQYARLLDQVKTVMPSNAPLPHPPVTARPTTLSVSSLQLFLTDPYSFYAKKILNLAPLSPFDEDPTAAERGSIIHQILEKIISQSINKKEKEADVLALAENELNAVRKTHPMIYEIWWPRIKKMLLLFLDEEELRRAYVKKTLTETTASWRIKGEAREYSITAKADRLDLLQDGTVEIIDYKTGEAPTLSDMILGKRPQLPVEGVMVTKGLFAEVSSSLLPHLSFWRLSHRPKQAKKTTYKDNQVEGLLDVTEEGVKGIVDILDNPETVFYAAPLPDYAQQYNDYVHLSRLKEWIAS